MTLSFTLRSVNTAPSRSPQNDKIKLFVPVRQLIMLDPIFAHRCGLKEIFRRGKFRNALLQKARRLICGQAFCFRILTTSKKHHDISQAQICNFVPKHLFMRCHFDKVKSQKREKQMTPIFFRLVIRVPRTP